MKKLIQIGYTVLAMSPIAALAIEAPTPTDTDIPTSLTTMINTVSNVILSIIGVVAVLFLIIGGFQYITSAGNPDSVSKAKSTILYAVLGILFAVLAYAIVNFIITGLIAQQ